MRFCASALIQISNKSGKTKEVPKERKNAKALTVFLSGKQDSMDRLVNLVSVPDNE